MAQGKQPLEGGVKAVNGIGVDSDFNSANLAEGGKVLRAAHGQRILGGGDGRRGTRFGLSKVELAHMGSDGEAQYLSGFLRCGCDEVHSIDPFHINPKVRSCFGKGDKALASMVDTRVP